MIEVTINGKKETVAEGTTITDILQVKEVRPEMVAVEVNGELIQKGEYATLALSLGDRMEFLYYMAGGDFWLAISPWACEHEIWEHESKKMRTCGLMRPEGPVLMRREARRFTWSQQSELKIG